MSLWIYTAKVGISNRRSQRSRSQQRAMQVWNRRKIYEVFAFCLTFLPDGGSSTSTKTLPLNVTMQVKVDSVRAFVSNFGPTRPSPTHHVSFLFCIFISYLFNLYFLLIHSLTNSHTLFLSTPTTTHLPSVYLLHFPPRQLVSTDSPLVFHLSSGLACSCCHWSVLASLLAFLIRQCSFGYCTEFSLGLARLRGRLPLPS